MGYSRTEHSKISIASDFVYDMTDEAVLEKCGLGLDDSSDDDSD